jgi:hypothetical protein
LTQRLRACERWVAAPVRRAVPRATAIVARNPNQGASSSHTKSADGSSQAEAVGSLQAVVLAHAVSDAQRQVVAGALQPASFAHVYAKSAWHRLPSTCLPVMQVLLGPGWSAVPPMVR